MESSKGLLGHKELALELCTCELRYIGPYVLGLKYISIIGLLIYSRAYVYHLLSHPKISISYEKGVISIVLFAALKQGR